MIIACLFFQAEAGIRDGHVTGVQTVLFRLVAKAVEAAGGEIIAREYTTDKANDFTAILTNIKAREPDAIFFGGLDAQSGPMRRQMATLGIEAPLVSGEMTRSETFLKLAGDAAN